MRGRKGRKRATERTGACEGAATGTTVSGAPTNAKRLDDDYESRRMISTTTNLGRLAEEQVSKRP